MMTRGPLFALLAAVFVTLVVADGNDPNDHETTLSKLAPAAINVTLTYIINNQAYPNSIGCTNATLGDPCLPHVSQTTGDRVNISWAPNANWKNPYPATATIKLCYSPYSSKERAWRKFDDRIYHDKQCATTIGPSNRLAEGLPATGNFTWRVPTKLAKGTYYLRLYYVCDQGSAGRTWCAYGNSYGFFEAVPIQNVTDSLRNLVIGMCFVGPVLLAIAYTTEQVLKVRKRK